MNLYDSLKHQSYLKQFHQDRRSKYSNTRLPHFSHGELTCLDDQNNDDTLKFSSKNRRKRDRPIIEPSHLNDIDEETTGVSLELSYKKYMSLLKESNADRAEYKYRLYLEQILNKIHTTKVSICYMATFFLVTSL